MQHSYEIKRVGRTTKTKKGLWRVKCECGWQRLAYGQMFIARALAKHLKEQVRTNGEAA